MNMQITKAPVAALGDALADLSFANRNPSWGEYKASSPCDQRAILKRWFKISDLPTEEGLQAWYKWHRAAIGCLHADDPRRQAVSHRAGFNEEYVGEAQDRQVDARGFNLASKD